MLSRNTSIPVTPGDHLGSDQAYFDQLSASQTPQAGPSPVSTPNPGLVNGAIKDALSSASGGQKLWDRYKDLGLSGRIITATVCIPYKLHFATGQNWVRRNLVYMKSLIY